MKPLSTTSALLIASVAAVCTFASQPARASAEDKQSAFSSEKEYVIGAGDKLRIEVYKDQQLSQSLQVRPDGKITLPLVGDLDASGSTPIALRDTITTRLKEYV